MICYICGLEEATEEYERGLIGRSCKEKVKCICCEAVVKDIYRNKSEKVVCITCERKEKQNETNEG
jgi:hypothetical protein